MFQGMPTQHAHYTHMHTHTRAHTHTPTHTHTHTYTHTHMYSTYTCAHITHTHTSRHIIGTFYFADGPHGWWTHTKGRENNKCRLTPILRTSQDMNMLKGGPRCIPNRIPYIEVDSSVEYSSNTLLSDKLTVIKGHPKMTLYKCEMDPVSPGFRRKERFSVAERMQLLENITDYHEFYCGLSPVQAKGGEVYLCKNDQHPGEECIKAQPHVLNKHCTTSHPFQQ